MNISVMTIITRVLFNSIIVLIQFFLLKNISKSRFLNSKLLIVFTTLVIFSLLFPIELGYTIEIPSTKILPLFQSFLESIVFLNFNIEITVLDILIFIWFSGILIKIYILFKKHTYIKKFISSCPEQQSNILLDNQSKLVRVVQLDIKNSPCVFNWKKPIIILPSLDLTNKELNYVIQHELLHISNSDLLIKHCYEFFLAIYWWNPCAYSLRRQMNQILELRVDEQMIQNFTEEEKIQYIELMIKISKQIYYKKNNSQLLAMFTSKKNSLLLNRSRYILSSNNSKIETNGLFLLIVFMLGIFIQTSIVFEPYSIKESDAEYTFEIKKDNSFLILEKDGTYKLYIDGNYVVTIQDIDDSSDIEMLKIFKYDEFPH